MTPDEVKTVVLQELGNIAPEADIGGLDPNVPLRDELDIDSMDFLNLVIALHERLGVDIPEADYRRLASIKTTVDYLAARLSGGSASGSI